MMNGHRVADRPPCIVFGHSGVYVKIDEIDDRPDDGSRDCWSLREGSSRNLHGLDYHGIGYHGCSGMYCLDGSDGGKKKVRIRPDMRNLGRYYTDMYFFDYYGMEGAHNSRHTYYDDHSSQRMNFFDGCGVKKGQDSLRIRHRDHTHSSTRIVLDSPSPSPIPILHVRSRRHMGGLENDWFVEEDHPVLFYHDPELVELY